MSEPMSKSKAIRIVLLIIAGIGLILIWWRVGYWEAMGVGVLLILLAIVFR